MKALSAAFFLVAFLILLKVFFPNNYLDFNSYYYSGFTLFTEGASPYTSAKIDFLYPPFALLILFPLKFLSYSLATKLWTFFSMAALFTSIFLIFKINKRKINSILGFSVLGLICLSFPIKYTLSTGQINNFILLLIVLAYYFLNDKKLFLSSFSLSLSLILKIFPVFLPLYFLITKRWRFLFFISLILLTFSLLALIILGPNLNIYFYEKVVPTLINGWKTDYYNQSLTGFIGRSFFQNNIREILRFSLSAIIFLVSFFVIFKTCKNKNLQNMHLSMLITLNLLLNNFSWQHHFVFTILPFLVILFFIIDRKLSYKYLSFLLMSYLLIALNIKNPNDFPILIRSHVFYGAVLLWFLQIYLILKNLPQLQPNSSLASKH